ncbi:MAG: transposase [Chloroflexota bacterium]|nr:transposase [Chloroflexota bacterium]
MVQEAYVGGVSTCRVEELVGALGVANLSKSEVSRICAGLDAEDDAFRSRPARRGGVPACLARALYHKVRESGRVVSMATLIAIGISAAGERSVLGVEVAAAGGDEGSSWLPFPALAQRAWPKRRAAGHPRCVASVAAPYRMFF